jgi:hypothetical protein
MTTFPADSETYILDGVDFTYQQRSFPISAQFPLV